MAGLVDDTVPAAAVAIYAHPNDPSVSCGGTIARWVAGGAAVHVVVCCRGDKGSADAATDPDDLAGRRTEELLASSRRLGVTTTEVLGFGDGEVTNDVALRAQLVAVVRRVRPDVVLCPDPTAVFFGDSYVNHRDHREVGWAALDAVAPAAGSPLYFPDAGPAHQVRALYLSGTLEPNTWVDVGPVIEAKVAALACHTSQLGGAGEWLHELVSERAAEAGRLVGVRHAEAFRRLRLS